MPSLRNERPGARWCWAGPFRGPTPGRGADEVGVSVLLDDPEGQCRRQVGLAAAHGLRQQDVGHIGHQGEAVVGAKGLRHECQATHAEPPGPWAGCPPG